MITIDDTRTNLAHVMQSVTVDTQTRPVPLHAEDAWLPIQALGESRVGHQLVGYMVSGVTRCGIQVATGDRAAVHAEGDAPPRLAMCPRCAGAGR